MIRRGAAVGFVAVAAIAIFVAPFGATGTAPPTVVRPPAQTGPEGTYTPNGPLLVDNGFRAPKNGFSFRNYGSGFQDLTPGELRRFFGDAVCASAPSDTCVLTPPALQWMSVANREMQGGHCFGFSVASLQLFQGLLRADQYGGRTTPDIRLLGNQLIQRELAYAWATWLLDKVQASIVTGTPNDILDRLIQTIRPNAAETYTIALWSPTGKEGHGVTPYAVEDRKDGTFAVLIYDNNLPGTTRAMIFNRTTNSWAYDLSTLPDRPTALWHGDAVSKSVALIPTSATVGQQPCPFCRAGGGGGVPAPAPPAPGGGHFTQLVLQGGTSQHGHLLITDSQGRRYGYVGDQFVTEIPGVESRPVPLVASWQVQAEPIYRVPAGLPVSVTVDGTTLTRPDQTRVVFIGQGYDVAVDGIELQPGQRDALTVAPDGTAVSYRPARAESPVVELGIEQPGASHAFTLSGTGLAANATLQVHLDSQQGTLSVNRLDAPTRAAYNVQLRRVTRDGQLGFHHNDVRVVSGATATLDYGAWQQANQSIQLTTTSPSGTQRAVQLRNQGPTRG